jgi:sugar/nucleoside kinase (ribokinase family)
VTKNNRQTVADPPIIVVHGLAHAVAALEAAAEAGRKVILASAPNAGIYGGPGWWREMIAAARAAVPAAQCASLLDCGDDAGAAQAAIRAGVEGVVFTGGADVADRLADIAAQREVRFVTNRPEPALDLVDTFFAAPETLRRRCADVLASRQGFC